jgi:hypothetical protein
LLDQLFEFLGNALALERYRFRTILVNRRYRALTSPRQADADVGLLALAWSVDDTAHDRHREVLNADVGAPPFGHAPAQVRLDLLSQ